MALYLVQHGQSAAKDVDPSRPLTEEGRSTVKRIAQIAAGYGVSVSMIRHSGKRRAQETAEIMASLLNPAEGVRQSDGLNPNDDVRNLSRHISETDNVMLVGHLPFMEKLLSFLVAGSPDITVMKFQQGGIVCLDRDHEGGSWFIKWALMPKIQ